MARPVLAALLLTLLLAMPALAEGGPRDERMERRQEFSERWQTLTPAQRDQGLARAEQHGLFSRLAYSNATGQAAGLFVRFHVQADAGAIHDVRVRANRTLALVPVFAGVAPDAFTLEGGPTVHGATLALDGAQVDLRAHNNPTAGLTWRAASAVNLTFTLAAGVTVIANDTREVRLSVGATHAHIVSNASAPLRVAGGTVAVPLGAGDAAMVRVHPVGDALAGGLHDLISAFKEHRLGATLRVADAGGVAAEDGEAADVHASTRSIARGRVVWDVSSAQHAGRVLFLTLGNDTVDTARLAQVALTLNGTPLPKLDSAAAVVKATASAFALVQGGDLKSVTVVVAIPHFSSYALALSQPAAGATTSPAAGGSGAGAATTAAPGADAGSSSSRSTPVPGLAAGALLALGLAALARRRA